MQWNVAEGYDIAYQEPGPGSVAIAETMNQVRHCVSLHCCSSDSTCDSHHASSLQNQYKMQQRLYITTLVLPHDREHR